MEDNIIGKPIDRKDGPLKVTGTATYAGEFQLKNMAYGVTVQSTPPHRRLWPPPRHVRCLACGIARSSRSPVPTP